jgi:hypothetical protein
MTAVPLVLSLVAIVISLLALWKTHFSPFSPLAVAGPRLTLRIYPIQSGPQRWFIVSLNVPISITNEGARPGVVNGLRLRLHFPGIPIPGNRDFIETAFEIDPKDAKQISSSRFEWLDKIVLGSWMPFTVLPKATVTKHFVFETRWEEPVIQKIVTCTLQVRSASKAWKDVATWDLTLIGEIWSELANRGTSLAFDLKGVGHDAEGCFPADLHKYTGIKGPIPQGGFDMASSRLDYPHTDETNDDE